MGKENPDSKIEKIVLRAQNDKIYATSPSGPGPGLENFLKPGPGFGGPARNFTSMQ